MYKGNIYNLIISYFGLVLGFLNTIYLKPKVITAEEIGLIGVVLSMATIYQYFTLFGIPSVVLKFYPILKKEKKESE